MELINVISWKSLIFRITFSNMENVSGVQPITNLAAKSLLQMTKNSNWKCPNVTWRSLTKFEINSHQRKPALLSQTDLITSQWRHFYYYSNTHKKKHSTNHARTTQKCQAHSPKNKKGFPHFLLAIQTFLHDTCTDLFFLFRNYDAKDIFYCVAGSFNQFEISWNANLFKKKTLHLPPAFLVTMKSWAPAQGSITFSVIKIPHI